MMDFKDLTHFAPAERAPKEVYNQDFRLLSDDRIVVEVLRSLPNIVLVLNEHRQVVYYNNALLSALGIDDGADILGMRPGEIINCIHSKETPSGCGTSVFCRYCGAVLAILAAIDGGSETRECRIRYKDEGKEAAMDLNVTASHTVLCNRAYVVFSINDVSDKKKRDVLEKIFFHDVLNTASSLHSAIDFIINSPDKSVQSEIIKLLPKISSRLLDEIRSQQNLLLAESGELKITITSIESKAIIMELIDEYQFVNSFEDKHVECDPQSYAVNFWSDHTLVKRVLVNMLKNATEASKHGESVTIGCEQTQAGFQFYVHNVGIMPEAVRMQVFNRSFSTKGNNRGIGTYSMKLLGENYLGAKVRFESQSGLGTKFYLSFEMDKVGHMPLV